MIRKLVVLLSVIFVASLFMAGAAFAIPALQLDILGGDYVGGDEESTLTGDDVFTLYALLTPQDHNAFSEYQDADTWYAVSIAVTPGFGKTEPSVAPVLGQIGFEGVTYDVTGDFDFGDVPVDVTAAELPTHGIFPTYYIEYEFQFDMNQTAGTYNVQEDAGDPDLTGSGSYYIGFQVDTTLLAEGHELHFDLYDRNDGSFKAPFSHDAGTTQVPEPGTLVLLGIGLLGVAAFRRKSA